MSQASAPTQVVFSSDVKNMDSWARRTGIPLTTAEAIGTAYGRAHHWLLDLKCQLIENHRWEDSDFDERMLFCIECPSPWVSSGGMPLSPPLKLQLPIHASSFFTPKRRVQWQMVFHSDIFATQRKVCQPLSDIFNLIQCLLTGVVTLTMEEHLPEGTYLTTRGLPSVEWVHREEGYLKDIFDQAHFRQLCKACSDTTLSFKVDFRPRCYAVS